ncbi:hypothetical protein ACLS0R_11850 [Comamonas jiangduensis]|uniref:hypothetical protein n=1 Tax=Comamonas jiangduensis TaxID=1194168 RepID=UPI003BF7ED38
MLMTAAKLLSVVDSTGQCNTMTASGGISVGMTRRLRIYYTEAKKGLMWVVEKFKIIFIILTKK